MPLSDLDKTEKQLDLKHKLAKFLSANYRYQLESEMVNMVIKHRGKKYMTEKELEYLLMHKVRLSDYLLIQEKLKWLKPYSLSS